MIGAIHSGWTSANTTEVNAIAAQVCQTIAWGAGFNVPGGDCGTGAYCSTGAPGGAEPAGATGGGGTNGGGGGGGGGGIAAPGGTGAGSGTCPADGYGASGGDSAASTGLRRGWVSMTSPRRI